MKTDKTEKYDIATIESANTKKLLTIFTVDGVDPVIKFIAEEAREHVPDLSTDKGRKAVASNAFKVSQSKVVLGKIARNLTADMKAQCKVIDASIKKMEDSCDELRDEARQPLTDWETAEQEREAAEKLTAEIEQATVEAYTHNDIVDREREVAKKEEALAMAEEKRLAAEYEKQAAKERLEREEIIRQEAIAEEKRLAEAEKIRVATEAQEAIDKVNREKHEAEVNAEIEKREAKEEAERAKVQAEEEKQQAIEDERKRVAEKAEAERLIADKIASNKAHQKKINNAALSALCGIVTEPEAKKIILAIAKGEIPHVCINY